MTVIFALSHPFNHLKHSKNRNVFNVERLKRRNDVTAYYIVMNFVIWAWDLLFVDGVQPIGNEFKTDLRIRMCA